MDDTINVITSPESIIPPDDHHQRINECANEICRLLEKYDMEAFMLTLQTAGPKSVISTMISPYATEPAAKLMANALKTFYELRDAKNK